MSDNLRDKIAAIVGTHEHWQRLGVRWECACGAEVPLKVQIDAHIADVLIRELGLHEEVDDKAAFRMEPSRSRYVTDWTTADE